MKAWLYHLTKFLCWLILRLGFGLEVRGQEHVPAQGPCIVASNHVSYLDPVVVGVACPRRLTFLAREDLFHGWALGAWMRGVGVIPLRRDEADLTAIRMAVTHLRRGQPVALFPEGGRQFSGQLGTAKRGVGLLAATARAPIVPVYLQGTFDALPPGARSLRRAKIRVAFGPPIAYTEAPVPSGRAHQAQLAHAVTDHWRRLEEELRRQPPRDDDRGRHHIDVV